MWDANHNPADYGENLGRGGFMIDLHTLAVYQTSTAIACEALARRMVHITEPNRIGTVMSTRFKHRQIDGDISEMSSALEMAIDQHWYASIHLLAMKKN